MADNIKLEVVTPEKLVVSEEAQIVMSPGSEGEFGVLDGHTPFLTTLKTGMIRYKDASGAERAVFVSGGFAEALPNKVTVLAESAERRRDINVERARAALARAEERLGKSVSDHEVDVVRAKAALMRAITRLNVIGTK
ncbi:F0F1 ATP synthase subunit epsilon [Desulfatiferula olefinivorans]